MKGSNSVSVLERASTLINKSSKKPQKTLTGFKEGKYGYSKTLSSASESMLSDDEIRLVSNPDGVSGQRFLKSFSKTKADVAASPESLNPGKVPTTHVEINFGKSKKPSTNPTTKFHLSASDETMEERSPADTSLRFLKSRPPVREAATPPKLGLAKPSHQAVRTSTEDESDMAAYMQGLSTDDSILSHKEESRKENSRVTNSTLSATKIHSSPNQHILEVSELRSSRANENRFRRIALESNVISHMGLLTVDDLLEPPTAVTRRVETPKSPEIEKTESIETYKSEVTIQTDESSLHTSSVKTEPPSNEVKTASQVSTEGSPSADSYESDFDDTLRESVSISYDDRKSRLSTQSSYTGGSNSPAESDSDSYTSFSSTRSSSYGVRQSLSGASFHHRDTSSTSDHHRPRSFSDHHSSMSPSDRIQSKDSSVHSRADSYQGSLLPQENKKPEVMTAEASIQTGIDLDDVILKYFWAESQAHLKSKNTEGSICGGPTENYFQKPSNLSALAISNEALEVLTTYSPAVLALNDMLKQQLELSRSFLIMQKELQSSILQSIDKSHTYTTLEETKQYIQSKRKEQLTFEDALQLVKEEMML